MLLTFQNLVKPIAILFEALAIQDKMHMALTGGNLYKDGDRKDVDFIIYHERGKTEADKEEDFKSFLLRLRAAGACNVREFGFVTKLDWQGNNIDVLYPEYNLDGTYPLEDDGEPTTVPPIPFTFPGAS